MVNQEHHGSFLFLLNLRDTTFLRQTFHEYAQHSIAKSEWARSYYEMQHSKGKAHNAIVRALAFKWIRILFRCWQDRVPYDESVHMASLTKRGSCLVAALPPNTSIVWRSIAGFSKLTLKKT